MQRAEAFHKWAVNQSHFDRGLDVYLSTLPQHLASVENDVRQQILKAIKLKVLKRHISDVQGYYCILILANSSILSIELLILDQEKFADVNLDNRMSGQD